MRYLIPLIFLFSIPVQAEALKGIYLNNTGTEALKEKYISKAQQNYLKALSENPRNHVARLNLGVSFIYGNELDKALKEFELSARAEDSHPEVRHYSYFNKAKVFHDQKKVEEALAAYQESLKYKKDSLQAKANIEMLVQQKQGQGKGGSGDEQENNQNKDENQQGQGDQKDQKQDQQQDGEKKDEKNQKPKKPQDLSEKDIEKILEELKNQEQKIRALEYGKKAKENQSGKTW